MRATLKQAIQLLGLAAIVTTSAPSMADGPRWFDIEVIVFKRNVSVESSQEYWPQPQTFSVNTSEPLLAPLFACNTEPCIRPRFEQLPVTIDGRGWPITGATHRQMLNADQLELGEQFAKLNQHAAFTPLIHLAWREVVAPRHRAKFYQLQAGQDFSQRFQADGHLINFAAHNDAIVNAKSDEQNKLGETSLFEQATPLNGETSSDAVAQVPAEIWELNGGIRIYLQHYLYIESQLILKRPVEVEREVLPSDRQTQLTPPNPLPNNEPQQVVILSGEQKGVEDGSLIANYQTEEELHSFKFDQKRRVRSGEIHYFDHPLMGMLIQIRRSPENQSALSPTSIADGQDNDMAEIIAPEQKSLEGNSAESATTEAVFTAPASQTAS
ncbi:MULTISPECIES: peptidoglycan binding protein CsiV [unclassified Agarivorans]|uniref:peptidoglycan binding protein CsiV n=1 Tax=unclassified Agarivorans TaxID=2636026 RepID=UPI003D7C454F